MPVVDEVVHLLGAAGAKQTFSQPGRGYNSDNDNGNLFEDIGGEVMHASVGVAEPRCFEI